MVPMDDVSVTFKNDYIEQIAGKDLTKPDVVASITDYIMSVGINTENIDKYIFLTVLI